MVCDAPVACTHLKLSVKVTVKVTHSLLSVLLSFESSVASDIRDDDSWPEGTLPRKQRRRKMDTWKHDRGAKICERLGGRLHALRTGRKLKISRRQELLQAGSAMFRSSAVHDSAPPFPTKHACTLNSTFAEHLVRHINARRALCDHAVCAMAATPAPSCTWNATSSTIWCRPRQLTSNYTTSFDCIRR